MSYVIRRLLKPKKINKPEVLELSDLSTWLDQHTSPMLDRFKREARAILTEIDRSVSNTKIKAQKLCMKN
jgi:hypothetical protein